MQSEQPSLPSSLSLARTLSLSLSSLPILKILCTFSASKEQMPCHSLPLLRRNEQKARFLSPSLPFPATVVVRRFPVCLPPLRRPTDRGETKVNERSSGWARLSCGSGFALSRNLGRISPARAEREGRGSGSTSFLPPPEQCRCPSSPLSLDLAEKRVGSPVSLSGRFGEGRSERTDEAAEKIVHYRFCSSLRRHR